jgi:hypothetical protein
MTTILLVAALAILALITQAGVLVLQRIHPAQGTIVEVTGQNSTSSRSDGVTLWGRLS